MKRTFLLFLAIILPIFTNAQIEINEIMYDLEGPDSGREWVEVFNNSTSEVNLSDWKFNDGSNHVLNEPPKNGGKGFFLIPAYGYIVFADNAEIFFTEHPDYSGVLIDTVMSLNNTADILKLFNKEEMEIDSVSYNNTFGASGDGNSLQKVNNKWLPASPSFGSQNSGPKESQNQNNQSDNSNFLNNEQLFNNSYSASLEEESVKYIRDDKTLFKESKIKAYAGENKLGISGADIVFDGNAAGLKDYPLDSAKIRFVWNFGDGAYYEGKTAKHSYFFPGSYVAVLDVASGEYTASDRVAVKVLANEIFISEADANYGWIEFYNNAQDTIDISFWQVSLFGKNFVFPKNTFFGGKKYLVVSQAISGIDFVNKKEGEIKLLYPNGSSANNFNYKGDANDNNSFSVINKNVVLSLKTPGKENVAEKTAIQSTIEVGGFPVVVKNNDTQFSKSKNTFITKKEIQKPIYSDYDKLKNTEEDLSLVVLPRLSVVTSEEGIKEENARENNTTSFLNTSQTAATVLDNDGQSNGNPSKLKWILIASALTLFSGVVFLLF